MKSPLPHPPKKCVPKPEEKGNEDCKKWSKNVKKGICKKNTVKKQCPCMCTAT